MRLERLCWEPRGRFYIAWTDVGTFKVPAVPGGWAQRAHWPYSVLCKGDFLGTNIPAILGMIQAAPRAAPPKLGGCNCFSRRQ